jgi:high-affinity K+ transport system ATPase subunit B
VEDLYFGLIEKDQNVIAKFSIQPDQIKSLINEINPPSLERLPIWLIISPDVLVGIIVVIILLLVIISGMQQGLNEKFAYPVILLLVYFIFRRNFNDQYTAKKKEREKEINQAQKAADRWSSLFICLHDMTVFSGHSDNYFPISEFQNRLLTDTLLDSSAH